MTTDGTPPNGNAPPTPSTAPASSPPASGPPEFRFGNDPSVPEYARGRTAAEVLALTESLHQAVRSMTPPAPPPQAAAPPAGLSLADEFLLRPEEATRKVADDVFAARMAPALQGLQGIAQQFAQTQRVLAESKWDTEFRKWGPEIDALMAQAAPEQRTLENYEKVVTYIRGKHLDELAEERYTQRMQAQVGVGERSGGGIGVPGSTSPTGVDFTKLPQGLGKVAERVGLTETMVIDFCRRTGITPQQWMENALNEKVVTSVAPFSFQIAPEHLGVKRAFDS